MLAGWLEQRARNMELSEKVSQNAIIIYESSGVRNTSFGFDATLESLMRAVKSSIH